MISKDQNTEILSKNASFTTAVQAYKALLTANNFPLTIDVELLRTTLRTQLFQQLLTVDKGLSMRFNMLKNDEARLKLISDTIDLNGYDIIPELEEAVKGLEIAYKKVYVTGWGYLPQVVSFAKFVEVYELDLAAVLNAHTYDFTGKEHVLRYVESLGTQLAELRDIFRTTRSTSYTLGDTVRTVSQFFTNESNIGDVQADHGGVMRLAKDLEKAGKLNSIPRV